MITGVKIRQNSLPWLLSGGFSDKRTGAVASVWRRSRCVFSRGGMCISVFPEDQRVHPAVQLSSAVTAPL